MMNLLLNAVEELVMKANNEIEETRKDIKAFENQGDKVNRVYECHEFVDKLVDRIIILKDKFEVDYPDEKELLLAIEKDIHILLVQTEDVLNMAYDVGNVMIDDLDFNYEDEYERYEDYE